MGRQYAGILGLIAFATMIARGVVRGAGAETTLWPAMLGMFAMAAFGWVVGQVAEWMTEDSAQSRFRAELAAREAVTQATAKAGTGK